VRPAVALADAGKAIGFCVRSPASLTPTRRRLNSTAVVSHQARSRSWVMPVRESSSRRIRIWWSGRSECWRTAL